jgi:hypothetical protein
MSSSEPPLQPSKASVHQAQAMFQTGIFEVAISNQHSQVFCSLSDGDENVCSIERCDFQARAIVVVPHKLPPDGTTLLAPQFQNGNRFARVEDQIHGGKSGHKNSQGFLEKQEIIQCHK